MRSRDPLSPILTLAALTVASSQAFAQDSNVNEVYVFSGTVTSVSGPFGVALGVEKGDERGYSIGFNFSRAGVIDESIAELFRFPLAVFPTFAGGFYADLVAGSIQGPAESACFLFNTLDTPSNGEGNGGIALDTGTSVYIGYANDFILLEDFSLVDPEDWAVGTQINIEENICDFERQGTVQIFSAVTLDQIIESPGGDFPDGSGDIVGRVTASTGGPPEGAVVVAFLGDTVKAASSVDINGDYFLRNLRTSSDYQLKVFACGFEVTTQSVAIADSLGAIAHLSLTPGVFDDTITGGVTDASSGALIGGVLVEALTLSGERLAFTYTCGDGLYELRGLSTAKQTLLQVRTSGSGYEIDEAEVAVGGEHSPGINKQLLPGVINGRVSDTSGNALSGVEVSVQGLSSTIQLFSETQEDGLFTTGNLSNGEYEVRVSAPTYVAKSENVDVVSAPVQKDITMEAGETPPPTLEDESKGGCSSSGSTANSPGGLLGDLLAVLLALAALLGASRTRAPRAGL